MAQCPVCKNVLPDDFGLVECSRCGAGLFIEIDGKVTSAPQPQPPEGFPGLEASLGSGRIDPPEGSLAAHFEVQDSSEEVQGPPVGLRPEATSVVAGEGSQVATDMTMRAAVPASTVAGADRTFVTGGQSESIPLRESPGMIIAEPTQALGGVQDLSDFANSDASAGRDGAYHYDLFISGIDSGDLRAAVKEILSDKLFLWDVEALARSIAHGELRISQVTSIKAALVVQRMSELPVKIRWVQHALAQS